ncbi:MAG: hypothetical protein ACM3QS_04065, partial [Bacteroidota bacterium]
MTVKTNLKSIFSKSAHAVPLPGENKPVPVLSRLSKRAILIISLVVVLAAAGGLAYYRLVYLPGQTSTTAQMQTAVARQGNLVLYASGTGTLISKTETGLAFKTGGQVTSIAVQVGQQVKA